MDDRVKERLVKMSDGSLVERDVLNVVDKIRDYDPNIRVKYCDPARAEFGDAPYRIMELCPDGMERMIMSVWTLDESVLERLVACDNRRTNVLRDLEGNNLSVEKENHRRFREEMDEAADILHHYLASPKGRYSFVDPKTEHKITLDDQEGIPAKVESRPI